MLALLLLSLTVLQGSEAHCGDRLERALDLMQQRGNSARRRHDAEDADVVYHERLRSAPIDVSLTKLLVEIPGRSGSSSSISSSSSSSRDGLSWAKVERCAYEPSNNSIRTRVGFNELAVSGLVQLVAHEPSGSSGRSSGPLLPAESCRMSLRLRRAGMEFYTSPIARGRGQMRIRTESSFLEPRFASIYAYGCRPIVGALPPSPPTYDRVQSEPRKRELAKASLAGLASGSSDSNSLASCTDCEEEDATEEQNRLVASAPLPLTADPGEMSSDALLDSLWRSRGDIAREMEDVFLRTASQAITHYIERQLHPAIKETLMLSMGYTISYG